MEFSPTGDVLDEVSAAGISSSVVHCLLCAGGGLSRVRSAGDLLFARVVLAGVKVRQSCKERAGKSYG